VTTFSAISPSNTRRGDIFDEDGLTHTSDSEGDETQCPWTSSEWVTGPSTIVIVLEQPNR
jgi:hypothetical protein